MEPIFRPEWDEAIQALVEKTGAFIREEFLRFSFSEVSYKAENDPFSFVDVSAEKMLQEGCHDLIPGSGFINEEGPDIIGENAYRWIIDPLDGTVNFMHGIPHFCISLALQYEEITVAGYVYGVMEKEMYVAKEGQGAFLNGHPIHVSDRKGLRQSVIVTGFPYAYADWVEDYLKVVSDLIRQCHGIRRLGSAALDMAYVAAGRVEGFFEFGLKPWDVAAGALLIKEAGGRVSDFDRGENYLFGRQVLGTNAAVHEPMIEVLQQYLPRSLFLEAGPE